MYTVIRFLKEMYDIITVNYSSIDVKEFFPIRINIRF